MGRESYDLGRTGEEQAKAYLKEQGYSILETNFRSLRGEIDVVARENEFLVFVEIKNYSYRSFGLPATVIKKAKKKSIIQAARYYLYKNQIKGINCRFDVLTFYCQKDGGRVIELFKNAFQVN
jgi:putative endonuclease